VSEKSQREQQIWIFEGGWFCGDGGWKKNREGSDYDLRFEPDLFMIVKILVFLVLRFGFQGVFRYEIWGLCF
jgi:hypothetical protein